MTFGRANAGRGHRGPRCACEDRGAATISLDSDVAPIVARQRAAGECDLFIPPVRAGRRPSTRCSSPSRAGARTANLTGSDTPYTTTPTFASRRPSSGAAGARGPGPALGSALGSPCVTSRDRQALDMDERRGRSPRSAPCSMRDDHIDTAASTSRVGRETSARRSPDGRNAVSSSPRSCPARFPAGVLAPAFEPPRL